MDINAGAGFTPGASYSPGITQGNYGKPGFDADYEERMLYKYRDRLFDQIKELESEDSPYKAKAGEISKNLKTVVMFVENQLYEKQVLRKKLDELRREDSEKLLNPIAAARAIERKNFRFLASMGRRLNEMDRLLNTSKTSRSDSMRSEMARRALEISTELKYRVDIL